MNLLVTTEEYKLLSGKKLVPCVCILCGKSFSRKKEVIVKSLKHYGKAGYCSRECSNKAKINHVFLPCEECGLVTKKRAYDVKNNKHVFCSYACHARYKNKNKKHGTRRSAIESHIEEMIRCTFPSLMFVCNDTTVLKGLELDFYFPLLKLAIELNGITHYEPIYGEDRLTRSKDSDQRKMISCYEKGVELVVLDVSGAKYLTKRWKETYWHEVLSILNIVNLPFLHC